MKNFERKKNMEIECRPTRLDIGTEAAERSIQTKKNLNIPNLATKIGISENVNRALKTMRLTIHTGQKVNAFEQHHGRKPRI